MKTREMVIFLGLVLLLTACSGQKALNVDPVIQTNTAAAAENECLPPIVDFAYERSGDFDVKEYDEGDVLPVKDWKNITSLPETDQVFPDLLFVRTVQNRDELWLYSNRYIYIYDVKNNLWNKINLVEEEYFYYHELFLSTNNEVWAVRENSSHTDTYLVRLNDQYKFESVMDQNQIFETLQKPNIIDTKVDHSGLFWMLIEENGHTPEEMTHLYSFDPVSRKAVYHLSYRNLNYEIEISPDNRIFLFDTDEQVLIVYSPSTQSTIVYGPILQRHMQMVEMYFDHAERLWINTEGWFDFSDSNSVPNWYTIVPEPIFIQYLDPAGTYKWDRPTPLLESTDGMIWFSSRIRGMYRLDPEKGEWCRFTTYSSNIVEDSDHHLWMILGNTLYQYTPRP